jgi:hypothetical protein
VQERAAVAVEDADAAPLAGPREIRHASIDQFLLGHEVPLDRRDVLVVRDMEVVVEVAAQ